MNKALGSNSSTEKQKFHEMTGWKKDEKKEIKEEKSGEEEERRPKCTQHVMYYQESAD
jgi:hypothetical protein